jgi:hypothetical protein
MADVPGLAQALRLLGIGLALLLAGCASQFRAPDLDAGVGQLTRADALARFGRPVERTRVGEDEIWTYTESYGVTFGSPYYVDPLGPTAVAGDVPTAREASPRPPVGAYEPIRRIRLFFDAGGVLRRWEETP